MKKAAVFKGNLLPHQMEALKKLDKTDAILLYHSLGSGKSATSIAGSEGREADVVVPASLRENYKKEVSKFTSRPSKRNIMSYEKFTKEGPSYNSKTLVMDEAQRIGRAESSRSKNVMDYAKNYEKRILLSGTPALNSPRELAPIIRTLSPEKKNIPIDQTLFNKRYIGEKKINPSIWKRIMGASPGVEFYPINTEEIKDAVLGKVHYYKSSKEGFPDRIDKTKLIEASPEQDKIYRYVTSKADPVVAMKVRANLPLSKKELKSINSFMGAARQVSNTTSSYGGQETYSNKTKEIASDIKEKSKKNKDHKSIVYSNYIASGIDEIGRILDDEGISYEKYTGKMSDKDKKNAVEKYNSGKTKALLVSSSGSEGLDLKGTRSIHIMEPHWNKNRIEQVIGRGIRYKSHDHLPEKDRKVEVIKYHTTLPKTKIQKIFKKDPDTSADQYLDDLSEEKDALLSKFLEIFKEEGLNKESSLNKTFNYGSPNAAFSAVSRIGKISDKHDHHPKIILDGEKVTVKSTTHDQGKVTKKDHDLIREIVMSKKAATFDEHLKKSVKRKAAATYKKHIAAAEPVGAISGGLAGTALGRGIGGVRGKVVGKAAGMIFGKRLGHDVGIERKITPPEGIYKTALNIDLNVGDTVLAGRFKNIKREVKSLGTDDLGQPTYNKGKKLLAVRLEKTMPKEMKKESSVIGMIYKKSFDKELEKVALSNKTMEAATSLAAYDIPRLVTLLRKGYGDIGRKQAQRMIDASDSGYNSIIIFNRIANNRDTIKNLARNTLKERRLLIKGFNK